MNMAQLAAVKRPHAWTANAPASALAEAFHATRCSRWSSDDLAGELYARHVLRCVFVSANLDEAVKRALQLCEPIE